MTGGDDRRRGRYMAGLGVLSDAGWAFVDPAGRVVDVDANLCQLLGERVTAAELVGRLWQPQMMQLVGGALEPGAAGQALERCRDGEQSAADVLLADGRILSFQHAAVPLDDGVGHVWRVCDVTVSRTHVAALRDAVQSAERANESRRNLLAGLSHELRTPLNAIIGMSDLIAETAVDGDVGQLVSGIERNARRLMDLLDRLLSFAGERARLDSLTPSSFSPLALIDEIASGHADAESRPLLLCRRGPEVPQRVVGDRSAIELLLTRLLDHALDGAPADATVEIGVEVAGAPSPGAGDDGGGLSLAFTVRDTVDRRFEADPAAVLDAIFWDGMTDHQEAGVGRQIVGGLVDRLGGTLDVHPDPRGTRYVLTCPVTVEVGPDRSEPLVDRRILIADPRPERRALHAELCLEWGAAIRTAADSDAVAAALSRGGLDLALVADPLVITQPGLPWIRLAAPAQLDVDLPGCRWRLGPTPQLTELAAAFERCLADEHEAPDVGPARVLVVEDLPDNAVIIRRFLERAGHRVTLATTGAAALTAIRAETWDIVLMDINLPDVDGIEVTARMRAFESRAHLGRTPVIAVTAYATDAVRTRAHTAGLQAFLTKPIDRRVLLDAVARHGRRGPVGLIVEPDPVGRLLLIRRARRRASLRLRWAIDRAGAMALVEQDAVAFALIDASLPDGDGLALVKALVARGIRCALVIDRDARELRAAALEAGCVDALAKPVAADAVARVLARLCSDTGALSPIRPRR